MVCLMDDGHVDDVAAILATMNPDTNVDADHLVNWPERPMPPPGSTADVDGCRCHRSMLIVYVGPIVS